MAAIPPVEIVYYVAASLDGFIATADGGIDWRSEESGAWLASGGKLAAAFRAEGFIT